MKMSRSEIKEKLKDILLAVDDSKREQIENADETLDLKNDFGFSSINILFLVIAIEEEFSIRFENVTMNDFTVLGDVITYIEGKL